MDPQEVRYQGPAGEVKIRLGQGHRLGSSLWFVALTGILFSAWAGWYFFRADQTAFLGTPLSVAHYNLQDRCSSCHLPATGVTNAACAGKDCHLKTIRNNFHVNLKQPCTGCHPEHQNARELPRSMPDRVCADCHRRLGKDPNSKFFTGRPQTHTSVIDRRLFSHRKHRGYLCPVCHGRGEGSINVNFRELFTMNTCGKCHLLEDCQVCHRYHGQRVTASKVEKPKEPETMKAEGVQLNLPPTSEQPGGTP